MSLELTPAEKIEAWDLIERICEHASYGIELVFNRSNDEGVGPNNQLVELLSEMTEWEHQRFYGRTRLDCLKAIWEAIETWNKTPIDKRDKFCGCTPTTR